MRRVRNAAIAAIIAVTLAIPGTVAVRSTEAAAPTANPCVALEQIVKQIPPTSPVYRAATMLLNMCYAYFPPAT